MTVLDRLRTALTRLASAEPVAVVSAFVAVLALVGVQVAAEDQTAAVSVLVVVLPLVGALVARRAVTPTGRAVEGEQQAIADTLSALADGTLDPYVHDPARNLSVLLPTSAPGAVVEDLPADDRPLCCQAGGDPNCYFPAGHDSVCEPYIARPGGGGAS